jgi:tRNA(Arg) A34 adenosine deaminase TadA
MKSFKPGVLDTLFSSARVMERRDFLAAGAALVTATVAGTGPSIAQTAVASKPVTAEDRKYMAEAIRLMRQAGVIEKTGGPFGAVIARNGEVLSATGNSVLRDNDPSAHAEVNAIRAACKKVGAPNLTGATMYSSCEPCPMCYSTAYWARLDRIYYAAGWADYADLFDDSNIGNDLKKSYPERQVPVSQLMPEDAQAVWLEYRRMPEKTRY